MIRHCQKPGADFDPQMISLHKKKEQAMPVLSFCGFSAPNNTFVRFSAFFVFSAGARTQPASATSNWE
jgi:hypothetical protein